MPGRRCGLSRPRAPSGACHPSVRVYVCLSHSLSHTAAAVDGPTILSPTAEITNVAFRNTFPVAVAASSSTAPILANDAEYLNLARLVTSEVYGAAAGAAAIAHHFGWARVAILADSSVWGKGAAQAFMNAYKSISPQYSIINENDASTFEFDGTQVRRNPVPLFQWLPP